MAYDPSEPRDRSGKWSGGGARGHNAGRGNRSLVDRIATQHQQDMIVAVGKGALIGAVEGVVASAVIGGVTGGFGVGAAPALIARGIASGIASGVRHSTVHAALGAAGGAVSGMQTSSKLAVHKENMKLNIGNQHRAVAKQRAKKEGY